MFLWCYEVGRLMVDEAWGGIKEMKTANADTISKKFVSNNGKDMSAQMRVFMRGGGGGGSGGGLN